MSDPLRTDPLRGTEPSIDADRDAKIESLLLAGLDHYFCGDYAQAIDVWTRALFLDRSHARARAYIERARSALAEQQRASEELLHSGIAAFERGQIEAARQLLNAAVQRGGAHDVALAFLTRIDRISAATPDAVLPVATVPQRPVTASTTAPRRAGARILAVVFLMVAAALTVYVLASWNQVRAMIPIPRNTAETSQTPVALPPEPLIVPRSSDAALERARALSASGRLYDALRALELVRDTDPLRTDADQLEQTIQRELIAHASAQPQ